MNDYDWEKIDDVVLALISLTLGANGPFTVRKTFGRALLDRLHERGWISNPVGRSQFVFLSDEGLAHAQEALERHLCKASGRAKVIKSRASKMTEARDGGRKVGSWAEEKTSPSLHADGLRSNESDTEPGYCLQTVQAANRAGDQASPGSSQDRLV